jgi:hypothetical protein
MALEKAGGSGSKKFPIDVDDKGVGNSCDKETCLGKTLHCSATIADPDGISCSGTVTSSNGSKHSFNNMKKGDKAFTFDLKTHSLGTTDLCVSLEATPVPDPGPDGKQVTVNLSYTY